MLVGQPRGGERARPGLSAGDLGCLKGWGHHDHPVAALREQRLGCGESFRFACAGSPFDDQQRGTAGERGHGRFLRDIQALGAGVGLGGGFRVGERGNVGRLLGATDESGDEVGLDGQYLGGGEGADVFGHVGAGEERLAGGQGSGGEVLGEIDPHCSVGHETGAGDPLLDLAADVGGVPRRPPCPQTGQDDLDHLDAVDPPDPRSAGHQR